MRRVVEENELATMDLDSGDVSEPSARQMRAVGVRSSALAPVRVEDTVVAILRVSARDDAAFGPVQQERLRAIANLAGLAVGNAERYQFAQREARRRAELEDLKSDFLRLASHELRGPIGLLRGYLSMFEDGTVPEVRGQARDTLLKNYMDQLATAYQELSRLKSLGMTEEHPSVKAAHESIGRAQRSSSIVKS